MKTRVYAKARMLVVVAATAATSAFAGNVCTWIGTSGRWDDSSNWQNGVKPVDGGGDDVYLTCASAGAVITNDIAGIRISYLRFTGDNPVTLVGEKIKFFEGVRALNASEINAPIEFPGNGSIQCGDSSVGTDSSKKSTFNGEITIANGASLYVSGGYGADFHGAICGGATSQLINGGVNWKEGVFSFFGPVKVKKVLQYSASQSIFRFYSTENEWDEFEASSYTMYYFMIKNAMPARAVLSFGSAGALSDWKGAYFCADQTLNRIEGIDPGSGKYGSEVFWIRNATGKDDNADLTMTLAGTASAKTYAKFVAGSYGGKWSLVWAPTGDYTQEFAEREQGITGTLTVSNGTVRVSGAGKFASLPTLVVKDGACFDCASTVSGALNNLKRIDLGRNAKFMLAATATAPCSSNPHVTMGIGSQFVLPAGASIAVGDLFSPDGRLVPGDTYTGSGSSGTRVPWIDGEGTVTVTPTGSYASWNQAANGDWNTAANWTSSVMPGDGRQAVVAVNGSSFTVSVNAAPSANPVGIRVENASEGEATTLSVAAPLAVNLADGKGLDIGRGGRMSVLANGDVFVTSADSPPKKSVASVRIHDGGELDVAGGKFRGQNFGGRIEVGSGGLLSVSSGAICITNRISASDGIWVEPGGRIELTGGTLLSSCYTTYARPITMRGGSIDCSGDAQILASAGFGIYFGNGELNLRGNSQLVPHTETARIFVAPYASGDAMTINVSEHARWFMRDAIETTIGYDCPDSRVVMNLSSDAESDLGAISYVGWQDGYGELNLSAGTLCAGTYGIRIGTLVDRDMEVPTREVHPRGRVSISGGQLKIYGAQAGYATEGMSGLLVGACQVFGGEHVAYGSDSEGELVSSGFVTNAYGFTAVGIGNARGRVVQTGGEIVTSSRPTIIGAYTGAGEWIVSNGVTHVLGDLYLGGITPAQWDRDFDALFPTNAAGTKGRLEAAGGEVVVSGNLFAGQAGALGTADIDIGPGGLLSSDSSIVLDNAKVSYRFGPTGVGRIHAASNLEIGANAILEIDISALAEKTRSHVLATASGGVVGDFASVVVQGADEGVNCIVRRTDKGYRLAFLHGLQMRIR